MGIPAHRFGPLSEELCLGCLDRTLIKHLVDIGKAIAGANGHRVVFGERCIFLFGIEIVPVKISKAGAAEQDDRERQPPGYRPVQKWSLIRTRHRLGKIDLAGNRLVKTDAFDGQMNFGLEA